MELACGQYGDVVSRLVVAASAALSSSSSVKEKPVNSLKVILSFKRFFVFTVHFFDNVYYVSVWFKLPIIF